MQEEEWDNKDRAEEITDGIMYEESKTRSITAAQVKEGTMTLESLLQSSRHIT